MNPGDDFDYSPLSPEVVTYVLRAHTKELHDIRLELHGDYLNKAQLMNDYIPREEHARQAKLRREWPIVVCAIVAGAGGIAQLIALLGTGH